MLDLNNMYRTFRQLWQAPVLMNSFKIIRPVDPWSLHSSLPFPPFRQDTKENAINDGIAIWL